MRKFIGHFKLLEPDKPISDTGLFEVYIAVDIRTTLVFILKVLKDEYSKDPEIVSQLREYYLDWLSASREAINLVEVSEISGQVGSTIYIVQEFFDGQPLHTYLRNNQPINILDFKAIFKQICDGLYGLHHEGICHYELLPRNILIHKYKKVKILSGGSLFLALGKEDLIHKILGDEKEFIAPEILAGKDKSEITQTCDIYSLAKIIDTIPFKKNKTILASAFDENPANRVQLVRFLYEKFDDIFLIDRVKEETQSKTKTTFEKEITLEQVKAKPNQPLPFKYTLPDHITKRPGIKIKCTSLPPFAYFDENSNEFSWKPGIEHRGEHTIQFQVTKGTETQTIKMPILVKTGMVIKDRMQEPEPPRTSSPIPSHKSMPAPSPYKKKETAKKKSRPIFDFKDYYGLLEKILKGYKSVKSYFRKNEQVQKAQSSEVPGGRVDRVNFSVTGPPSVMPGTSFIIDVWAHLKEQRNEVIKQALQASPKKDIVIKSRGPVSVTRGTVLTVKLSVEGFKIEDPMDTILWDADIGNVNFVVFVSKNTEYGIRRGKAVISVNGLRIAKLNFTISIGETYAKAEKLLTEKEMHRKAFASYSRADTNQVLPRIQGIQKGAPDLDIFMDVHSLRSGQNWENELWNIIPKVDVFYLFWSENAKKSKWVEKEWKCALETRGIDFIDPVPMVSPEKVPPPQELASKHFNDWILAYMRY